MDNKKRLFFPLLLLFVCSFVFSAPLYSPTWGFTIDLPEGYRYTGGNGNDSFSFETIDGAKFELIIYHAASGKAAPYASLEALITDVHSRLNNRINEAELFSYREKETWVMQLSFSESGSGGRSSLMSGWAFCTELPAKTPQSSPQYFTPLGPVEEAADRSENQRPMLLAMAYGPAEKQQLTALHLSSLDSIAPEESDKLAPGPITEFSFPRETRVQAPVFGLGVSALIYKEDAEAAQSLVDREFQVLRLYVDSPNWKEAWIRFYRAIYRDSFERLIDIAFQVERKLNVPARENRDMANQALQWVQSFAYERDFLGSDFVNLVSAATEGRGDCDSRSMLWTVILKHANIPSAIMVSRYYSHAMGLADLPGAGARFELDGEKLLVAETTAKVSIGLIGETVSEIEHWLGIAFEN